MNQALIRSKIVLEGMTQRGLAEKIGMTPNSLSRKLQRKRVFTLPEVCAICDVLHITDPVPYFFDGNRSALAKEGDQA